MKIAEVAGRSAGTIARGQHGLSRSVIYDDDSASRKVERALIDTTALIDAQVKTFNDRANFYKQEIQTTQEQQAQFDATLKSPEGSFDLATSDPERPSGDGTQESENYFDKYYKDTINDPDYWRIATDTDYSTRNKHLFHRDSIIGYSGFDDHDWFNGRSFYKSTTERLMTLVPFGEKQSQMSDEELVTYMQGKIDDLKEQGLLEATADDISSGSNSNKIVEILQRGSISVSDISELKREFLAGVGERGQSKIQKTRDTQSTLSDYYAEYSSGAISESELIDKKVQLTYDYLSSIRSELGIEFYDDTDTEGVFKYQTLQELKNGGLKEIVDYLQSKTNFKIPVFLRDDLSFGDNGQYIDGSSRWLNNINLVKRDDQVTESIERIRLKNQISERQLNKARSIIDDGFKYDSEDFSDVYNNDLTEIEIGDY